MPGTLKRLSIATAVAAVIGVATLPTAANAGPVEDLVGGVQKTVDDTLKSVSGLLGGGGAGGASPAPAPAPAPTPQAEGGSTSPELDGTNPHGQGEVLGVEIDLVDLEGDQDVLIGQSRGEQDESGDYHGSVTPVAILGIQVASVETDEGEEITGPTDALNDLLEEICTPTDICLTVLDVDSRADDSGSQNSFSAATASLPGELVTANALASDGNISDDGECQEATSSAETTLGVAGGAISAEALSSSSRSRACNDGSTETDKDGEVANLGALDALNVVEILMCDTTAEDTEFDLLGLGAVSGVCNGDDTDGAQADAPYNVRKALGLDLLDNILGVIDIGGLASLDAATSETLAQAPGEEPPECPDPDNPDCPQPPECPDPDNPDCPDGPEDECPDPDNPDCPDTTIESGGPGGPSADEPDEDLPFTGADLGTLGAIGLGVMALGLALMGAADRRRRTAA